MTGTAAADSTRGGGGGNQSSNAPTSGGGRFAFASAPDNNTYSRPSMPRSYGGGGGGGNQGRFGSSRGGGGNRSGGGTYGIGTGSLPSRNMRWNSGGRDDDNSRSPAVVEDGTWHTRGGRRPGNEKESEVFKSTKDKVTGINFDSYDAIDVEVSGADTEDIQPLTSFRTCDHVKIPDELMANILRVRYDRPTPVQKYGIPILLRDRDLMACAQTGSGKTAAFLFPIIIKMLHAGPPSSTVEQLQRSVAHPVALVLSPTRELTCQIYEESKKFAFGTGIRTVVVYGGAELRHQLWDLQRGCDICVATPGRLNDIMERGKVSLSSVQYLVLDEADRMLDMGFAPQIHELVEMKDMPTSQQGRQTAMFSATFPREIQQLASRFLQRYVYLTVGRVGSTNDFITQKLLYAEENAKPKGLLSLLKEAKGRVLVFVETRKKADVIENFLVQNGMKATSIHGDRTQVERSKALELFKGGECPILVATDVAARGLDIHSITWVINLDLPHNIEDYVHRIGRTGRAGNAGLATSFVNESNRPILRELHRLLEEAHQDVPNWFLDLTRACTSANTRGFGQSRYGGRGGGGRGNFGGVDYRFDNQQRTRYNAVGGGGGGGSGSPARGGGFHRDNHGFHHNQQQQHREHQGDRQNNSSRFPQRHQDGDDCW